MCTVYMLGMFMWELFARDRPFKDLDVDGARNAILQGKRPPKPDEKQCPLEIWKLIEKCWCEDPSERPLLGPILYRLKKIQNELYPLRPDALYISLLVCSVHFLFVFNND